MVKKSAARFFNGIMIADDWDDSGKVVGLAIYTDGENIYHCQPDDLSVDLLSFTKMRVRVEGTITRQPNGKKLIHVKTIEKLEEDVEDDDDTDAAL